MNTKKSKSTNGNLVAFVFVEIKFWHVVKAKGTYCHVTADLAKLMHVQHLQQTDEMSCPLLKLELFLVRVGNFGSSPGLPGTGSGSQVSESAVVPSDRGGITTFKLLSWVALRDGLRFVRGAEVRVYQC